MSEPENAPKNDPKQKLDAREEGALLWRLLQAFLWAYVATAVLLALGLWWWFERPGWAIGIGMIGVVALGGIVWAEIKLRRYRAKFKDPDLS